MRVMVILRATESSEAGVLPSEELLAAMGKYNEELVAAFWNGWGSIRTCLDGDGSRPG